MNSFAVVADSVPYRYSPLGRLYTHGELRQEVEAEAAGLPPEQWLDSEFRFSEWLSESVISRHAEKVWPGDE